MMIVIENSIIHSFATGMFFVCPSIFRQVFETTYIPDIFRVIIVSPTVFCVEAPLICLDSIKCAESAKRFGSLKKTKNRQLYLITQAFAVNINLDTSMSPDKIINF